MEQTPEIENTNVEKKPGLANVSLGNDTVLTNGDNNPTVRLSDTVGLVFMTAMAFALFIALLRSQARNRKLLERLANLRQ